MCFLMDKIEKNINLYESKIHLGYEKGQSAIILSMLNIGRTPKEISDFCNIPIEQITKVQTSQRV